MVGLGIWFYLSLSEFQPVVDRRDFAGPAYLILVAGGAAILAGIVGCVGGVNEHRHLLLLVSSGVLLRKVTYSADSIGLTQLVIKTLN